MSVLAAALSACVVEPEILNSERIAARFGSYGIEVLSYENGIRRSNLYSEHEGRRTCRTYAVVRFGDVKDSVIGQEHAQVLAGNSIGAVFKSRDWKIYKETRYVGSLFIPSGKHEISRLMAEQHLESAAMHVYRLLLRKQDQIVDYATIVEVHHPDYLSHEALSELYLVDTPVHLTENELLEISEIVLDRN